MRKRADGTVTIARHPPAVSILAAALALCAAPRPAAADDPERRADAEARGGGFRGPGYGATATPETRRGAASYDETDEAPLPGEPGRPSAGSTAAEGSEGRAGPLELDLSVDGKLRLELGQDSNVFRSPDRTRRGDAFFHGLGDVEALARFREGRELFASVAGEGIEYLRFPRADETYASSFVEYFHPVSEWLDVGIHNTLEYSRQNLLDDNGDLLPRETFNALDVEPRAFAILHATDALSLELGGGVRRKDFDEERGKQSLDFDEVRADAAIRARVPWWADGKTKLQYRFRDRTYRQLAALARDATLTLSNPRLVLERHQATTTLTQKLRPLGTELTVTLGYGFTYNRDAFENDRSYREQAGSLRVEWWLLRERTRLEAELRGGARDFLVRRATAPASPAGSLALPAPAALGPRLRHRFIDASALVWQKLVDHLALVAEAAYFDWGSSEPLESYGRFVVQAGLEASF